MEAVDGCREGNWDLVGNNFPVFFVRDGMSFPDMVHALKPNPKSHIQEGWRIADFFSHHPEAMHMVGIPCTEPSLIKVSGKQWATLKGVSASTEC